MLDLPPPPQKNAPSAGASAPRSWRMRPSSRTSSTLAAPLALMRGTAPNRAWKSSRATARSQRQPTSPSAASARSAPGSSRDSTSSSMQIQVRGSACVATSAVRRAPSSSRAARRVGRGTKSQVNSSSTPQCCRQWLTCRTAPKSEACVPRSTYTTCRTPCDASWGTSRSASSRAPNLY